MGTDEAGSGTSARHSRSAGAVTGTTVAAVAGNAVAAVKTNVECATDDCVRFDVAAQQVSACAWLMARPEPLRRDSDLCIGQLVPLLQHAIRASGVACHPAHTATLPMQSVRIDAMAARRRPRTATFLGCAQHLNLSNRHRDDVGLRQQESECRRSPEAS